MTKKFEILRKKHPPKYCDKNKRNFRHKSKLSSKLRSSSKMEIFVKNRNVRQKMEIFDKNPNFLQKSKFSAKI